ncbi:MAG: haloacid dehalogenase type II [Myxococcota bacterium]
MSEPIRAVLFDAFGTLFDVRGVDGLCVELFGEAGPELSATWRAKQLQYSWLLSLMERFEPFEGVTARALDHAAEAHGLTLGKDARDQLLAAYDVLPLFPEVRGALEALSGRELCVLSNGSPTMLGTVLGAAGVRGHFAHVFSASTAQVFKPSPRVYAVATSALDLPPAACAFVSSNAWDVAGAAAFGFRTFYLNRSGRPQETLGAPAAGTLESLDQLAAAL